MMLFPNDLKYAARLLLKNPGFTGLTTLVMAVGISICVYLFSMMHPIVFKDLSFEDGETLVKISASQENASQRGPINPHDYHEIRTNVKGLSEFGSYRNLVVNVSGRDGARRHIAVSAEPNIFQITRTQPALGRVFSEADNQAGAENVVVIGHEIWLNQFSADPNVINQNIRINGEPHKIIGVMPEGYMFPNIVEVWLPMRQNVTRMARGEADLVFGMAHLDGTATKQEIEAQLAVIMQRLKARYRDNLNDIKIIVDTFPLTMVGDGIVIVYSMHLISFLILVLASINVGNLFLSRAVERRKETAIRVALGAPRFRLISQMLWESVIICTVAGVAGLLMVAWALEVSNTIVSNFSYDGQPFWWQLSIGSYSVSLSIIFVVGTILVTGLLPAWKNTGSDFNSVLRDGTRGALGKKAGLLNRLLVISEIFVSMTVLISAGVLIVSNYVTTRVDYGADTDNTLIAEVSLSGSAYDTPFKQAQFAETLQSRLENAPGIGDVILSSALPGSRPPLSAVALEGQEYAKETADSYPQANYIGVATGSLEKLGTELKKGRFFNSSDNGFEKSTIIVSESFVNRHFPDGSPLGKRLRIVDNNSDSSQWLTIVGVVEHTIQTSADGGARVRTPSIFRPISQSPRQRLTIAMRMQADRNLATRTLRHTLGAIDAELPAFRVQTYAEKISRNSAATEFMSTMFLIFGIAAAILAATGIYGVMSNTISQRTQEIGVKRALGATDQRIMKEFLMTGLKQLSWGGIPGVLAGTGMGFVMASIRGTGDTASLLIIAVLVMTVIGIAVLFAAYLPTKRALKMEPSEALHHE